MAMKLIKKTSDYKIYMRGDDRYAVQDSNGKPVNGEEKVRILVAEELIKVTLPNPEAAVEEPAQDEVGVDEAVAEASAEEEAEASAEEAAAADAEEPAAEEAPAEPEPEGEPEPVAETEESAADPDAEEDTK